MRPSQTAAFNYPAADWVSMVVRVLESPLDVKTIPDWARLAGKSATSLKLRCRLAGLSAKESLDFSRLLRAFLLCEEDRREVLEFVDIRDPRTFHRVLSRFGLHPNVGPLSVAAFMAAAARVVPRDCLVPLSARIATGGRRDKGRSDRLSP